MNNLDDQKLLAELVKRAESGEHTKFEYIRTWKEYKLRKMNVRALKLLVNNLDRSTKSLFKKYCKQVKLGTADTTTLLVRNVLLHTLKFYKIELDTVLDVIYEYEAYLMDNGNFIGQFLLYEIRPISECWDRRDMDNGF
jgi:hypothetical protein